MPTVVMLLASCLAMPLWAGEPALGATVESLLDFARARNPEFAAMQAEAYAARERITSAGALPDPVLRTELMDITNAGSDARPNVLPSRIGSAKYTLMQPLPFWGKRDMKREAASAQADAVQAKAGATWNELASRIKSAYADYYGLSQQLRLTRETLDLIADIDRITQSRYAGGLVPQQDAIRVLVERTAMQNELIQLETEHHHHLSDINALLSRPALAPLAEPQRLRPLPDAGRLDYAALEARLRGKNPQLFAEDANIRAAEKSRDLAYRNRYPDFTLGIAPTQMRNRVNEWELMLEFNIPLQQASRRSQEREAEKMLDAARLRKDAAANAALAELADSLAAIDAARRSETLAQTSLLPQAELTFRAALAGYENGKVDFATLLDAQRQIRNAKQGIFKAQAEQQARLADIERLVGEDL